MSRKINKHMTAAQFPSQGAQVGQQHYQPKAEPQYSQGPGLESREITPSLIEPNQQETKAEPANGDSSDKPHWKKQGLRKLTNKERRRRQNQSLRRLVSPKSALMVLNEMLCDAPLLFRVTENIRSGHYASNSASFTAELTIDGNTYRGCGDSKTAARTAAAEPAVRDLIIKKMDKYNSLAHADNKDSEGNEKTETEEEMPMIQLASFALHKLFNEWEGEGLRVPQLRPSNAPAANSEMEAEVEVEAVTPAPKLKKVKALPENAGAMHPCMLLTYMRPLQEYREIRVEGDRPQNLVYTIGVEVDSSTFVGQGPKKKEARKAAATAACHALFGVEFQ